MIEPYLTTQCSHVLVLDHNIYFNFFPSGHGNESYNLIGSYRGPDFSISDHSHSNARVSFLQWAFFV